jgi:hypothetical protein
MEILVVGMDEWATAWARPEQGGSERGPRTSTTRQRQIPTMLSWPGMLLACLASLCIIGAKIGKYVFS